jgi:hypothetical protein
MRAALFRSTKEPNLFAFTADLSGSNLPTGFGLWQESQEDLSAQMNGIFPAGGRPWLVRSLKRSSVTVFI